MQIEIPEKLIPIFQGEARYRGAHGGRGSAKSATFAKMLLLKGLEKPRRLLCGREFQNSIKDSVHAELCKQVDTLGLRDFYDCQDKKIVGRNGTEILYRGFWNNLNSIKSMTDIDIVWLEEAEYISENSWKVLIPTIRNDNSEIWATWNPERTDSPTKLRLIDDAPSNAKITEINWRDNPWFPSVLEMERQAMLRRDPDGYQHVWEGKCSTRSDAQIFRGKWIVDNFTPDPATWHPYYGADWGFSTDPTVLVKCWVHGHNLYIDQEAYGVHTELDDIPALFDKVTDCRKYRIYADNARPETISHVKAKGFNIEGVEKWKGSVEDGIEYIRGSFDKIIVRPSCPKTVNELLLYSHKIDKLTSEVLPDIVDKHNHCMDAMRYALSRLIKRRSSLFGI
jgi:phage terminase large subunit